MKISVIIENKTIILEYERPLLLSEILRDAGVVMEMPCGGRQRCFQCRVHATGNLSPYTTEERAHLTERELEEGIRFACMTYALGDSEVSPCHSYRSEQIVTEGIAAEIVGTPWAEGYGAAVDIGTTTLAAGLYDLKSGEKIAAAAMHNPQASYGADVISRMERHLSGDGDLLAQAVRNGINALLTELCTQAKITQEKLQAVSICGNSTMLYLLCNYSPKSIATAPFRLDHRFGCFVNPEEIGVCAKAAKIYLVKCISAYVGADMTAALLASGLCSSFSPQTRLLIDIGTNGEMALVHRGICYTASAAAGPAFEGAGISMGMPALQGAICKVDVSEGNISVSSIGDGVPTGICGSGIVDAIAAMLRLGVLDETGSFNRDALGSSKYIIQRPDGDAFCIPGTDVYITQKDVRAIQLAKAAICAGIEALLAQASASPEEVAQLMIAGGFGRYLNAQSAETIGLIPRGMAARTLFLGNAALAGTAMILKSQKALGQSEQLVDRVRQIELSTDENFKEQYIEHMFFPE